MRDPFRILIIDDNPVDREIFGRLLRGDREHGYEVTEAATGAEGIRLCRSSAPDCVLLDYQLPDANGLDVLADLVRDHTMPDTPVVMLTGQGSYATDVEAIKVGAQDYLVKDGVTGPILWRTIRHAIERHRLMVALKKELVYRARLETELRDSEARARMLTEVSGDGIITFGAGGVIESFNPTAESLFGYAASEVIGTNVSLLLPALLTGVGSDDGEVTGPVLGRRRISALRKDASTFSADTIVNAVHLAERRLFTCVVRGAAGRIAAD